MSSHQRSHASSRPLPEGYWEIGAILAHNELSAAASQKATYRVLDKSRKSTWGAEILLNIPTVNVQQYGQG